MKYLQSSQSSARSTSVQRFHYLSADLTIPTEATRIIAEATSWNNSIPPTHIFCVAGGAHPGYFLDLPASVLKSQMDTNYFSAAYIAHAACQAWLSSPTSTPPTSTPSHSPSRSELETRHLVLTSSLAAFLPIAGYTPYTPAKTALRALSESLSQELLLYSHITPIRSHCVFPGTIKSPGLEVENALKPDITKQLEEGEADGAQTAEEVALETIRGLEAGAENVSCGGLLGRAMKAGMLGASRRVGLGVIDTVMSWVVVIILVIVRRDMDGKVRKWGLEKMSGRGKG